MKQTNILLTCAGRRCDIVETFIDALDQRGSVFACDFSRDAPALKVANHAFTVPPVTHPDYIDALLEICQGNSIRMLIPALEPELPLMAGNRDRFLSVGTLPLISSGEVVNTCYDKVATNQFLSECGLLFPRTYLSIAEAREAISRNELFFPVIIKPRWGVSSIATERADNFEEMELIFNLAQRRIVGTFLAEISSTDPGRSIIIQQCMTGQEYGMDVVNDLEGRHVATFVKRKLRIRAGLTDRAVTANDDDLEHLGRQLGQNLGHVGLMDCDVFVTGHQLYVLDLNPRIGGGYPFSHVAGANYPAALIAWINGEEPNPTWLKVRPDVMVCKSDSMQILDHKEGQIVHISGNGIGKELCIST